MIFVDSNVPMYLVGADPHRKLAVQRAVGALIRHQEQLVTSVEVFQELLHRFVAIRRLDALEPAFVVLEAMVEKVLSIEHDQILAAKAIALGHPGLPARDCLHVAVMRQHEIDRVLSFDCHFDQVAGVERLPAER